MSELVKKSEAQEEQEQTIQIRAAAEHVAGLIIGVSVVAVLPSWPPKPFPLRTSTRCSLRAESRSPTLKDTRTGRWPLPPGPMECSK